MTAKPVGTVDAKTLHGWMEKDSVTVIDVRETDEFARSRLPGASNRPLSAAKPSDIHVDPNRHLVIMCASGARSKQFCDRLAAEGYEVSTLEGGLNAWSKAGFPVEENRKAPFPIMRQVQITAGSMVLIGVLLGYFYHPGFYGLSGFVGAGLMFAGITGTCAMASILGMMPWNRTAPKAPVSGQPASGAA